MRPLAVEFFETLLKNSGFQKNPTMPPKISRGWYYLEVVTIKKVVWDGDKDSALDIHEYRFHMHENVIYFDHKGRLRDLSATFVSLPETPEK